MADDQPPATRRSLIVRLRDPGDAAAWGQFVAQYEPFVYRLARRKGLQDADARDLVQEVFRALARSVEQWDPERGRFRAWISRIARNLLINLLSRQPVGGRGSGSTSVRDLLDDQAAGDPAATAMFEAEYRRHVFRQAAEEVRGEFAPATWLAFWQTAVDDRPPAEVASTLGSSVGAVYVARSRVLARLRKRVEEREEFEREPDEARHAPAPHGL